MAPEQRGELTSLRLSSAEFELLKAAATQTGLSQSDVLRQALRAYCANLGLDVSNPPKPTKVAPAKGGLVERNTMTTRSTMVKRGVLTPRSPLKPKK